MQAFECGVEWTFLCEDNLKIREMKVRLWELGGSCTFSMHLHQSSSALRVLGMAVQPLC